MTENTIELKSVKELLGMKFFIPSYQRGYRWTDRQVKDLLNDLWEFARQKNADYNFYCVQPLVVRQMSVEEKKANPSYNYCHFSCGCRHNHRSQVI